MREGVFFPSSNGLRIQLLREFRVTIGDEQIPPERWRLRKARSLVKLIALSRDMRLHREQLMDILWHGYTVESASNNLHQALHAARQALNFNHGAQKDFIFFENEIIGFCPETSPWVDVTEFESAAEEARRSKDPAAYQAAIDLYSGDLLPEDLYEDWAFARRESLHQAYLNLVFGLAKDYEAKTEYSAAISLLQKIVEVEPTREETHLDLIRLYALDGKRQLALRQYTHIKDILRRELDSEPEPQTVRLYQKILAGKFPAVAPEAQRVLITPEPVVSDGQLLTKHNLPRPLSSFIGRSKQLQQIKILLADSHLLTLTGPGGVGKTSLAIQVTWQTLDKYPDGAWLVDLTAISDSTQVPQAITKAFGLPAEGNEPFQSILKNYLASRECLLVLDNCEHMIEACAQIVETLLQTCPGLQVMATSREPLGVPGEAFYRVPPMDFPDPGQLPELGRLLEYDAVRLFSERARAAYPAFEVNPENAQTIARICQRLDGIPLALELAAAWLDLLSTDEIAARLDDRFRLLTGGSRTSLPRHRTLQASIDWSYNLLEESEKTFLQKLSVFSGGWSLAAAEEVCTNPSDNGHALDLLAQLVKKSMVIVERGSGTAARYRMLETIHQYAQDKLEEAGKLSELRDRHIDYFLALAKKYQQRTGLKYTDKINLLDELRRNHDNLINALEWASGDPAVAYASRGLELACALDEYWYISRFWKTGSGWVTRGLELIDHDDPTYDVLRAHAYIVLGWLSFSGFSRVVRENHFQKGIALFRKSDNPHGLASALMIQAQYFHQYDYASMIASASQALAIARKTGDIPLILRILVTQLDWDMVEGAEKLAVIDEANALFLKYREIDDLGNPLEVNAILNKAKGEYHVARRYYQEMYEASIRQNDRGSSFKANIAIAELSYVVSDFQAMKDSYNTFLSEAFDVPYNCWEYFCFRQIGIAAKRLDQFGEAARYYLKSMPLSLAHEDPYGVYASLAGLGGIAAQAGFPLQAVRLLGASQGLFDKFTKSMDQCDQLEFDRDVETARQAIGETEFKEAWSAGRALTLDQAIQEALAVANSIAAEFIRSDVTLEPF